jgi:hypothetical protein
MGEWLGFKKYPRRSDHCDGLYCKIVFASHNIVNMNGYHEEEVLGKVLKCFKVRLQMVVPQVKFVSYFRTKPFENSYEL